ncbi:hypothetical protein [Streptomyces boncukensis]|uniref:Uncharacterized protein n=1 Tax=Streptomyces boncukensis TaxID=2711219 RepID=A0A6G4WY65_9ACTN|nr:hypothetical protein [Streptomyces boncukensis]NGO69464.1 hypothetical protein [Streptomyces boncukensis]
MKTLLWLLLAAAVLGNVIGNFAVADGPLQIVVSSLCGVVVIGCGVALYLLRERDPDAFDKG